MKAPALQPINTSISDFPTLIREGFVYVDKTALIHELVRPDSDRIYFLSRPRRFGKSLMISTLEQVFKGNRAFFKGLAIDGMKYDWKVYPVLRLDMSLVKSGDLAGYRKALCAIVGSASRGLGCEPGPEKNPGLVLSHLLDAVSTRGEQLVVLVDEYDAPISGLLNKPELLKNVRTLRMAGATINAEVESANGRADAILETPKAVYICEFKYGKYAKAALKQCHDRNYAAPYATEQRKIVYFGINYDTKKQSVDALSEVVNEVASEVVNPIDEVVNEVVKSSPGIRKPGILERVDKSRATVERALARLIAAHSIEFRGAPKTGGYYAL